MTNTTTNTTTTTREWTANAKQKAFMEVLAKAGRPITLKEIEVTTGNAFATGTINTLIAKGLVIATDTELVYTEYFMGVEVGTRKVKVKAYQLA